MNLQIDKIFEELKAKEIDVFLNKKISDFTTFKVGGPADLFCFIENETKLKDLVYIIQKSRLPYLFLGKGSNLLVMDQGIEGIVAILSGEFLEKKSLSEKEFYLGAGLELSEISHFSAEIGCTGLEFAVGIPGTLGGGIFMNAGAYDGELSECIKSVRWMDMDGLIHESSKEECQFGYRKSIFQSNQGIILGAVFHLEKGNTDDILHKIEDLTEKRNAKQPLEWPSAGSTFKRPVGYFAGTLIQECGLKGLSVGGAQVSEKHAGFVINKNEASADDILRLIQTVREEVYRKEKVWLVPEVRIVGKGKEKWELLYES